MGHGTVAWGWESSTGVHDCPIASSDYDRQIETSFGAPTSCAWLNLLTQHNPRYDLHLLAPIHGP